MIEKERVEDLISKRIEGTGLYLVDISVRPGNSIQVLIDSAEGISIETCAEISRYLNESIDREEEDYSLEVSSPGLGSPFKVRQQYDKNIGQDIEVVLVSGIKKRGKLLGVSDDRIELEVKEKVVVAGSRKKTTIPARIEIGFDEIKITKAVISFK